MTMRRANIWTKGLAASLLFLTAFAMSTAALAMELALSAGDFRGEIASLLKLGYQRNFSSIRGAYDAEMQSYATSRTLPNATECFIEVVGDDEDYNCIWDYGSDEQAARAAFRTLADGVGALSFHASAEDSTRSLGRYLVVESRSYYPERGVEGVTEVMVSLDHRLRRDEYSLHLHMKSRDLLGLNE